MRVFLLNNTEFYHCGSAAVMKNLRRQIRTLGHEIIGEQITGADVSREQLKAADWVVANGEGTMHDHLPHSQQIMRILGQAQELGKHTALLNCIWQERAPYFNEVLQKLDWFSVREPISAEWAAHCGRKPEVRLDLCVDTELVEPYTCYASLDAIPKRGEHWFLRRNRGRFDFRTFVHTRWATGDVFVTAEQHGVYAAGLAGVPFVALPITTHKIRGLLEFSKTGIPVSECEADGRQWAHEHLSRFQEFHDFLMTGPRLRLKEVFS